MFSMQCRKNITIEDNKKRMNIANLYIYMKTYIPILYVTRTNQDKNHSINLILQHGRVGKNCVLVFPTSRFSYLILCPR